MRCRLIVESFSVEDSEAQLDNGLFLRGQQPGQWRVIETIPRLLRIIDKEDPLAIVYDRALVALGRMGL